MNIFHIFLKLLLVLKKEKFFLFKSKLPTNNRILRTCMIKTTFVNYYKFNLWYLPLKKLAFNWLNQINNSFLSQQLLFNTRYQNAKLKTFNIS